MARGIKRGVDIHAVANRAGVSIATVSRVINCVPTVDAALVLRVEKAVKELGYTPDTQARALVSGRSRLIGLIVSEIINPFFPQLIESFERHAVSRGYEILLGSTNYSPDRMLQCVRRMVERKVEGVAIMTFDKDQDLLAALAEREIPVVSVSIPEAPPLVASIEIGYMQGIAEAVDHLAALGHRRIAFISGPSTISTAVTRREAFLEATAGLGIQAPAGSVYEGDHTMEGGFAGAEALFAQDPGPTAIVCSNDMTAIGVLHSASGRKLRIPEDVSVVGFDDIHMAQFTVPPLTSVRISSDELATTALDALPLTGGSLRTPGTEPNVVTTRLVVRQSSGPPPAEKATAAKGAAR